MLRPISPQRLEALRKSARASARSVPGWMFAAVGVAWTAATFSPNRRQMDEFPAAPWLAAVVAGYALLWWLARPLLGKSDAPPSRARVAALLVAVFGFECVFRLPALWLFQAAQVGLLCTALLLASGIISAYVVGRWSPVVLAVMAAPSALYLAGLPLADLIVYEPTLRRTVVAIACLLFLASLAPLLLTSIEIERKDAAYKDELDRRRREAESATAAKSTFIAVVSHELRTPISAILAAASQLERVIADPAAKSNARMISDAGDMMRTLLNDLLDTAKLEAGRMSVEEIPFDLRQLILDQVRLWRAEARKKGVRLRLRGSRDVPLAVRSDPTRLRQILNNLLSNALKFTEVGSVGLEISQFEAAGGRRGLRLDVVDTGTGMTEAQVAGLFQAFSQADASIARTHGGTGLGLSISLQLAHLMGGDITVTSSVGQGSCFSLALEVAEADRPTAEVTDASSSEFSELAGLSVLVVDDHEINRRAMNLLLDPLGFSITTATSGSDALRVLRQERFDLVFMDVHMPGLGGREATKRLRSEAGPNRNTPVIAVTGAVEQSDIDACAKAGMTGWVAKPIGAQELYAEISRQLSASGAARIVAA